MASGAVAAPELQAGMLRRIAGGDSPGSYPCGMQMLCKCNKTYDQPCSWPNARPDHKCTTSPLIPRPTRWPRLLLPLLMDSKPAVSQSRRQRFRHKCSAALSQHPASTGVTCDNAWASWCSPPPIAAPLTAQSTNFSTWSLPMLLERLAGVQETERLVSARSQQGVSRSWS
jgi:hypothetical protein